MRAVRRIASTFWNWIKPFLDVTPPTVSAYFRAVRLNREQFLEEFRKLIWKHYAAVTFRFLVLFIAVDVLLFRILSNHTSYSIGTNAPFIASLWIAYWAAFHTANQYVYKDAKQFQMFEYINNISHLCESDLTTGQRQEILLKNHELTLQRYYSQKLTQNSWVVFCGLLCVVLGVGLIAVSLIQLTKAEHEPAELIPPILGIVSGLATNFVAAMFLQIYKGVETSLRTFHDRIVATHHYYLANYLANEIKDDAAAGLRDATLAKISESIASLKPSKDTASP